MTPPATLEPPQVLSDPSESLNKPSNPSISDLKDTTQSKQTTRQVYRPGKGAYIREDGKTGRPKGRKNNATLLARASQGIVKHYIKRTKTSDPVLIDAMKRILPIENESGEHGNKLIIMGDLNLTPRSISTDPAPDAAHTPPPYAAQHPSPIIEAEAHDSDADTPP